MTESPTRIAVAVVRWNDDVLVGVRPNHVPLAGLAEFPGGKCLPHETPEEAAVRECLEETGLEVEARRRLCEVEHRYPHGTLHLIFIECQPRTWQPPRPPFRWLSQQQLCQLPFPEANQAALDLLT